MAVSAAYEAWGGHERQAKALTSALFERCVCAFRRGHDKILSVWVGIYYDGFNGSRISQISRPVNGWDLPAGTSCFPGLRDGNAGPFNMLSFLGLRALF